MTVAHLRISHLLKPAFFLCLLTCLRLKFDFLNTRVGNGAFDKSTLVLSDEDIDLARTFVATAELTVSFIASVATARPMVSN